MCRSSWTATAFWASSPATIFSTTCAAARSDAAIRRGILNHLQKRAATMSDTSRFGTRAIHAGQAPDPTTGAVMTPIYATSTYAQASPGVHKGFEYARTQNPTRMAFERCIADLESRRQGFAF